MLPIMRIVFLFISLSISLHATVSKAEPSTHIRTLMDRPLSMLEWGMYKTEKRLNNRIAELKWSTKDQPVRAEVSYDWDADNIVIEIYHYYNLAQKYKLAEADCKFYFESIDLNLLISDGNNIGNFSLFGNLFKHNGWQTEAMVEAIEKISESPSDPV